MRDGETARHAATTAGTEFSCQKADQGKPSPLPESEWFCQLLLGVLKGGPDCIHGGNRQEVTSKGKVTPGRREVKKKSER